MDVGGASAVAVCLTVVLVALAAVSLHLFFRVRRLEQAMNRYVGPAVASKLARARGGKLLPGERRGVTVLSSDFRGFTRLSTLLPPEEVLETINGYYSFITEILHRHGGHLDKFIGDNVLACWGAPDIHPDDPERALRTAVEIQQATAEYNRKMKGNDKPTLVMGMGVTTGTVVAGSVGGAERVEYSIIGSTVNLACRLQSMALGGQILIHESTYRYLHDLVEVIRWRPTMVKGLEEPETIFQLLGVRKRKRDGLLERRAHLRIESNVRAAWHYADGPAVSPEERIVNLSAGGAALLTSQAITPDRDVRLTLNLPGEAAPLAVLGRVVGHQELDPLDASHRHVHRVQFTDLSESDKERILQFVYQVDRESADQQGFLKA